MISTVVTTSTVTTATALTSSLAIIGVVTLIVILIQKEFFASSESKKAKRINQVLNIALPPLLLTFLFIVINKILTAAN